MEIIFRIPIVGRLYRHVSIARERAVLQGYKKIKHDDKLDLLMQIKNTLSKTELHTSKFSARLVLKKANLELAARQFLVERLLDNSFNRAILYGVATGRPIKHPMPKEWRVALLDHGIAVNQSGSAVLWRVYSLLYFVKGLLLGFVSIWDQFQNRHIQLKRYAYFNDLNKYCISHSADVKNIVNWYLQWKDKQLNIDTICHGVSEQTRVQTAKNIKITQSDILPNLKGWALIQYGVFVVWTSFVCLALLPFRPIYGFFWSEILKQKRVFLSKPSDLAEEYLFHNSTPFYRPIWTSEAEKKGAKVLFYFYSTNNEVFGQIGEVVTQNPWHLISWPHYLVWDEPQKEFVANFDAHKATIEIVGPIWFSSRGLNTHIPDRSAAVFDVTPFRSTWYVSLGLGSEYYTHTNSVKFLNDVRFALSQNDTHMAHKIKRNNPLAHKRYISTLSQFKEQEGYIDINPDVDALQVIQKTKACISMPFTSTAIIAKNEGKPSVYYDPSGLVHKDDRAAHGIPILSSIDQLQDWLRSVMRE